MPIINAIDIDIFSLLIIAFIYTNSSKRADHVYTRYRLFMAMLGALTLLLLFDGATRIVNGLPGKAAYLMNWCFNNLLFLTVPLVPCFWALYADYQVYRDKKRFPRLLIILAAVILVNGLLTISSVFTGWFFTVDVSNLFHRGSMVLLHPLISFALLLYSMVFILLNRKKIDDRHFLSLLFFPLLPAIGATLEYLFYGLALSWSGMTLSMLLLHINIQDKRLDTDYLTGVYNRRQLDRHLRERIRLSAKKQNFSAILIDLDNFKVINDTLGHIMGDDALLDTVNLLKSCLRRNDFIARYGGDEFLVLLDIGELAVLEETVWRIKECCDRFNRTQARPYTLRFSTGYAVYDPSNGLDATGFLQQIDKRMYQEKNQDARHLS